MSQYELIPDDTYENLPEGDGDKFVALVRVAQSNLARMLDQQGSNEFADEVRSQFVSSMVSIADALGIEGVPDITEEVTDWRKYSLFQAKLAGIVAKARLRGQLIPQAHSVQLEPVTVARIRQEADLLRRLISDSSELSDNKKDALRAKLDELEKELSRKRVSFARIMAVLVPLATLFGGASTGIANAPKAMEAVNIILHAIGVDKEKEEGERLRLAPPPKPIADMRPQPAPPPFDNDLDDDVPF